MISRRVIAVLFVAGCSTIPTPEDCRRHGVEVPDGDPITGRIVAEHYADRKTVQYKCNGADNCARAAGFQNYVFNTAKGEYEIWYSDPQLIVHERCHSLYEVTHDSQN